MLLPTQSHTRVLRKPKAGELRYWRRLWRYRLAYARRLRALDLLLLRHRRLSSSLLLCLLFLPVADALDALDDLVLLFLQRALGHLYLFQFCLERLATATSFGELLVGLVELASNLLLQVDWLG
jgi:hypothetical protein